MRIGPTAVSVGVLCAVLAVGCTTKSTGDPGPTSTGSADTETTDRSSGSSMPASSLPTDGAPAVENPLDTAQFQQDPCQALTSGQSTELNVGNVGKPIDGALGKGCEWFNSETRGEAHVVFLDEDPRGLSALYRARSEYAYFEELGIIEDFPAVSRDGIDDRDNGFCTVVVGVSNEVAFETNLQLSTTNVGKKDPCEIAAQVAGMALQTMKQG